jgi:hypothetical protein
MILIPTRRAETSRGESCTPRTLVSNSETEDGSANAKDTSCQWERISLMHVHL